MTAWRPATRQRSSRCGTASRRRTVSPPTRPRSSKPARLSGAASLSHRGPEKRRYGVDRGDAVLLVWVAGGEDGDQVVAAVARDPAFAVDLPVGVGGGQRNPGVLQCH